MSRKPFSTPSPRPLSPKDVRAGGVLGDRIRRSYDRLERDDYRPDAVLKEPDYPWPGDMEGRLTLALTLLEQVTGRPARHLPELLDRLPGAFNEAGYLGRVATDRRHDEQQLSGHAWLLRGLCEQYEAHRDERALSWIDAIVRGLALPARDAYAAYPHETYADLLDGEAIGQIGRVDLGPWRLSTDIGCAFILLDGLSHVYRITEDPAVGDMLDAMAETFVELDFVKMSLQTHATLSGVRGLLRLAEQRRSTALLDEAQRIWRLYWTTARTANDANHNWFGRPHWTEPCAMVDAYMTAMSLWRLTGEAAFLRQAHRVAYNGLGFAQRPNGGYGCDCCVGAHDVYLAPQEGTYEAWWCCTMRGGEGLTRMAQDGWHMCDDALYLAAYADGVAHVTSEGGSATIAQKTTYPFNGEAAITVEEAAGEAFASIAFVVPEGGSATRVVVDGAPAPYETRDGFVHVPVTPRAGREIQAMFSLSVGAEPYVGGLDGGPHVCLRHGPLLLGIDMPKTSDESAARVTLTPNPKLEPLGDARYRIVGASCEVRPVCDHYALDPEAARHDRRQVIFPLEEE